MTLQTGFTYPVAEAQQSFRRILKAMSEPGTQVTLPLAQGWGELSAAATAVMLTLVDHETPLWLDKALNSDRLTDNLRFHTGVMLTEETTAPFALFGISSSIDLSSFATGNVLSPEKSTTVIVDVTSLQGGIPLQLSGPGLKTPQQVAPQLPADLLQYRCQHNGEFPAGLDLMFTCGDALMALPRTTHVEVY